MADEKNLPITRDDYIDSIEFYVDVYKCPHCGSGILDLDETNYCSKCGQRIFFDIGDTRKENQP